MVKKKESSKIVELKDVWKTYLMGEVEVNALRGLTFDVYEGEFLVLIGKSGSGKTTAVNQVGCLDYPTDGEVILDGQVTSELSESDLATARGQQIGYVFQQFNLIKTLSALENVELPMIFQGIDKEERRERATSLLEELGMKDRLYNKPSQLSGGQQQRVAIARALANDPPIILADEPTGNLDSNTGEVVMENLLKLNKEGKTVILVTHDDSLREFADRVVTIHDGKVLNIERGKK